MTTIRISQEVWDEIAKRGKFGETPDDVLRRVFDLNGTRSGIASSQTAPSGSRVRSSRPRYAKERMSARVDGGNLVVEFYHGPANRWALPAKSDKPGIAAVRRKAVEFAENNGATVGQVHAVVKAMTEAGYHVTK
jgi:hypothetical protein